eukprot:CAMPEP_0178929264 /NCGR_PEP_ID=MMETSP0786-20121207/20465_1 /TAXON_ID=186022 /ORGANISM="Thalassionema frauenfeldii, Strain CCMP 1798" /LENGTH=225 /DNA_ID=CAMNT_0020605425 /DNA_START=139 /DNA_END=813 /DNA_ORIENTATION=-
MSPASRSFVENNQDWAATCAIYGEQETHVEPIENDDGFRSSLTIQIRTSNMAFAYNCSDKKDHYRICTVENPPVLCLKFDYASFNTDSNNGDDDDESDQWSVTPHCVKVLWKYYPKEWPCEKEEDMLNWLQERSLELLDEQKMSFVVCEFCEHETLSYWPAFGKDSYSTYQLFLLPPNKVDWYKKYHNENYGLEVHVMQNRFETSKIKEPKSTLDYAKTTLCKNW